MMYARETVLVALLAVVLTAAPASAKPKPHRMTFQFASVVAADYWAKRNVTIPCRPRENLLSRAETAGWSDDGYDPDMLADVASCTVDVNPRADDYRYDRDGAWMYCMEIAHEIGHLAGLEHDYGGVMDPEQNIVPWGCDHPIKFRRQWDRRLREAARAER